MRFRSIAVLQYCSIADNVVWDFFGNSVFFGSMSVSGATHTLSVCVVYDGEDKARQGKGQKGKGRVGCVSGWVDKWVGRRRQMEMAVRDTVRYGLYYVGGLYVDARECDVGAG